MIIGAAALILWVELRENNLGRWLQKSFAMCDTEIFYDLNFFMGGVDLGTPFCLYVCFLNMTLNQGESKHAKLQNYDFSKYFHKCIYGARHCSRHLG